MVGDGGRAIRRRKRQTPRVNGADNSDIEQLRERCHTYEVALRKIIREEPNSRAAKTAKAALHLSS
jgi:hypothetical protein